MDAYLPNGSTVSEIWDRITQIEGVIVKLTKAVADAKQEGVSSKADCLEAKLTTLHKKKFVLLDAVADIESEQLVEELTLISDPEASLPVTSGPQKYVELGESIKRVTEQIWGVRKASAAAEQKGDKEVADRLWESQAPLYEAKVKLIKRLHAICAEAGLIQPYRPDDSEVLGASMPLVDALALAIVKSEESYKAMGKAAAAAERQGDGEQAASFSGLQQVFHKQKLALEERMLDIIDKALQQPPILPAWQKVTLTQPALKGGGTMQQPEQQAESTSTEPFEKKDHSRCGCLEGIVWRVRLWWAGVGHGYQPISSK